MSLVGTAIGLGLGALAGHLLVNVLAAATFVSPDVTTWVLIRGLLVGVGLGVLGALFSVAQVLRVPPRRHWDVPDESVVVHATDPRVEPMHSPGKPGMLTPAREKAARIWLIRHVIEEPEPLIRS